MVITFSVNAKIVHIWRRTALQSFLNLLHGGGRREDHADYFVCCLAARGNLPCAKFQADPDRHASCSGTGDAERAYFPSRSSSYYQSHNHAKPGGPACRPCSLHATGRAKCQQRVIGERSDTTLEANRKIGEAASEPNRSLKLSCVPGRPKRATSVPGGSQVRCFSLV